MNKFTVIFCYGCLLSIIGIIGSFFDNLSSHPEWTPFMVFGGLFMMTLSWLLEPKKEMRE